MMAPGLRNLSRHPPARVTQSEYVRTRPQASVFGREAYRSLDKKAAALVHSLTRKAITKQYVTAHADKATPDKTRLVHSHCQRRATGAQKDPALLYA
jgi:hypothetical protein